MAALNKWGSVEPSRLLNKINCYFEALPVQCIHGSHKYMVRRYCALAVVTVVLETRHGILPQYKYLQCCIWHQSWVSSLDGWFRAQKLPYKEVTELKVLQRFCNPPAVSLQYCTGRQSWVTSLRGRFSSRAQKHPYKEISELWGLTVL